MQLLDTILAFVLTLAALATVVTVIIEVVLRILGMRQRNLVEIMKLLNRELANIKIQDGKPLSPGERWHFIETVVINPSRVLDNELKNLMPKPEDKNAIIKDINEKTLSDNMTELGQLFVGESFLKKVGHALKRIFRDTRYETVSLEHVLRRLTDLPSVQEVAASSLEQVDMLKAEFNRLARRYEQFASSVAAHFRQNAQVVSFVVGILLAVAMNIDGLRIFETYHANTDLAQAIIARHDDFAAYAAKVSAVDLEKVKEAANKAQNNLNAKPDDADLKKIRDDAQDALSKLKTPEAIKKTADQAVKQLTELIALGVPIGWKENDKETKKRFETVGGIVVWGLSVLITGLLIGLGAPFWFDVAKRLGALRKGNRPTDSEESRMSARDANGDPEERKKIVDSVINDARNEAKMEESTNTGEGGEEPEQQPGLTT